MNPIIIEGGNKLNGCVSLQGSKNAVLPILAATLLIEEPCVLLGCPDILDVDNTLTIMKAIGAEIHQCSNQIIIWNKELYPERIPKHLMSTMRSSIMMAGALLGRYRQVTIGSPGGCVIGKRPIDMHLTAFQKMGVFVVHHDKEILLQSNGLKAYTHSLEKPSVGATENIILAAVLTAGITTITGAAKEPEIVHLCHFLKKAGADIMGEGTGQIVINGVKRLHGCTYMIPPDRIVAGTYMAAVMACGGDVLLKRAPVKEMQSVLAIAQRMGLQMHLNRDGLHIIMGQRPRAVPFLQTATYPGFPTDLQSIFMIPLVLAKGNSLLCENIFENRFRIVPELEKMGAVVKKGNNCVMIQGTSSLRGQNVEAKELRGAAALLIAGMSAKGITQLYGKPYLERGYQDFCKNLCALGAKIEYE